MTQIHMRSTEFGFHVRNPIPLTLGSQFSRKNLKDLIHLILKLFPNQADHLVNKLFGVDLSTHRPIHPDTSEKALTLDGLVVVVSITFSLKQVPIFRIGHESSPFLVEPFVLGIPQSNWSQVD